VPGLPDDTLEDSLEEAVFENTGLSNAFVTRVEVTIPSGECDSAQLFAIELSHGLDTRFEFLREFLTWRYNTCPQLYR
jgi:hypothetical protein